MSAAAIALLQGFKDYAASGKPFGYPAGSLQLIDQILQGNDPDVRGPMIRIPLEEGDCWIHVDAIGNVNDEKGQGICSIWERGTNTVWRTRLPADAVLSMIERASR